MIKGAGMSLTSLVVGCLGEEEDPEDVDEDTTIVDVLEQDFDPQIVEIEAGETIRWINRQRDATDLRNANWNGATDWGFTHTLTDIDHFVDYTFDEEGVYQYYDVISTPMRQCGMVLVGGAEWDGMLPCG